MKISESIELTPFRPEDKVNLLRYLNNDPAISANTLLIPDPYTEGDADDWLQHVRLRRETLGIDTEWAIRHREAGLIGAIGVFAREGLDSHIDEIGYWLAAPFRGQGIMTEVVRRFTDALFAQRPNLVRIQAFVFTQNPASLRVLEKAGFEPEGIIRKLYKKNGVLLDAVVLARLRH